MNLLSRLAPGEHGSNGEPFNYQTLYLAGAERVRQTLVELVKAKDPQVAMQHAHASEGQ